MTIKLKTQGQTQAQPIIEEITPELLLTSHMLQEEEYRTVTENNRKVMTEVGVTYMNARSLSPFNKSMVYKKYENFINQCTNKDGSWRQISQLKAAGTVAANDPRTSRYPIIRLTSLRRVKDLGKEYLVRSLWITGVDSVGKSISIAVGDIDFMFLPVVRQETIPINPHNPSEGTIVVSKIPNYESGDEGIKRFLTPYTKELATELLKQRTIEPEATSNGNILHPTQLTLEITTNSYPIAVEEDDFLTENFNATFKQLSGTSRRDTQTDRDLNHIQ